MRILISVNVGTARPLENAKSGVTGIFKEPISGPVRVTRDGLEGDVICDTKNHGGPDQAVYIYGTPDYSWWSERLQQELAPGTFGENLTVTDLESAALRIGDRFHIGSVTLEVTAPRIPCVTLARRMNDTSFVKQFIEAERPGIYCRVLQEGTLAAGDAVRHEPYAGEPLTVLEMMRDFYISELSETTLRRYLAAPIALRARTYLEKQLMERFSSPAVPPAAGSTC